MVNLLGMCCSCNSVRLDFMLSPHGVNGAIDGECFGERCCERACILLEFVYVCMSPEVDFPAYRFCSVCLC